MMLLCICVYWLLPYSFLPFPKIIFHCNLQSMTAPFLISVVYKPAPRSIIQTVDLSFLNLKIPPHLTESCQLAKSPWCERQTSVKTNQNKNLLGSLCSFQDILCQLGGFWLLVDGGQWGEVGCLAVTLSYPGIIDFDSLRIEPPEALSLPSSP